MRLGKADNSAIDWCISHRPVPYDAAIAFMETHVAAIRNGTAGELVWLLEHPPIYTAGTSAKEGDLLERTRFPVHYTGRGGQFTYHGPGQRVGYVMLDLKKRKSDVRAFVADMHRWLIAALTQFNLKGETRSDRVGIWITRPCADGTSREDKIAAIGLRVRRWVTYHGFSLNVEPDLSHFDGIVPCGVREHGVTSLVDLGRTATLHDADIALKTCFENIFGKSGTLREVAQLPSEKSLIRILG
jgi:lipoyl(octanoyl) transferase